MEDKESKRLAKLRAKRRMRSWNEQLNSPLQVLLVLLFMAVFIALIFAIALLVSGNPWPLIVTVVISGLLFWIFWRLHKRWKRKRYAELYEEELLNIKLQQHR